jgi:hypothetical protein
LWHQKPSTLTHNHSKYTIKKLLNMKRKLTLLCTVFFTVLCQAQTPNPAACNSSNCTTVSTTCNGTTQNTVTTFTSPTLQTNAGNSGLSIGSVWRYTAIATQGSNTVNAEVKIVNIVNAILDDVDDDANPSSVPTSLFAPRIGPDVNLDGLTGNTTRRGWVEFEIKFFTSGFTTVTPLANLNYVHFDVDGSGNSTSWFREMGHIKQSNTANPVIQAFGATELVGQTYTETGVNWAGFVGSVCERTGVSTCAEVAAQANFSAPQSTVAVRLGYDFKRTTAQNVNIGQPIRQYGTRFGCFDFPTTQNLPVTLGNFNVAKGSGSKVNINWQTLTEVNCTGFEIQRSNDGSYNFVTIATLPSQAFNGNSSSVLNYAATDEPNLSGVVYYRIRYTNTDGKWSFSTIKSVKLGGKQPITLYPNPSKVGSDVTIQVPTSMLGSTVAIKNAVGATVLTQKVQTTLLQFNQLSAGFYYLNIVDKNNEVVASEKFVVQ